MKNFVQGGDTITVSAPYDRSSGQGAKVGQIFGVCTGDALSGADVALKTTGIFDLTKAGSQAWTVGALVLLGRHQQALHDYRDRQPADRGCGCGRR